MHATHLFTAQPTALVLHVPVPQSTQCNDKQNILLILLPLGCIVMNANRQRIAAMSGTEVISAWEMCSQVAENFVMDLVPSAVMGQELCNQAKQSQESRASR